MIKIQPLVRTICLLVLLLLSQEGMDIRAGEGSIPNKENLKYRANEMCEAWKRNDLQKAYYLASPDVRRCVSYKEWVRDWESSGDGQFISCKITKIRKVEDSEIKGLTSQCSERELDLESAANVRVKIILRFPDGSTDVLNDMWNGWFLVNGIWYWYDWTSDSLH